MGKQSKAILPQLLRHYSREFGSTQREFCYLCAAHLMLCRSSILKQPSGQSVPLIRTLLQAAVAVDLFASAICLSALVAKSTMQWYNWQNRLCCGFPMTRLLP
jgi:hypothetical protein